MDAVMKRIWAQPEYPFRFVLFDGTDIYSKRIPEMTGMGYMWDTKHCVEMDTKVDEKWAAFNWQRSLQAFSTEHEKTVEENQSIAKKTDSVVSYIIAKVITPEKEAEVKIRCLITPELDILVEDTLNPQRPYDPKPENFVVNVTSGTYHKVGGVDIKIDTDPVLSAVRWLPLDHYRITKVTPISYGVIAITEGVVLKETHIYVFQNSKLVKK